MTGKEFFVADLHFGGETIIRYEKRPFASAEEMDRALTERWNAVVGPEDTVYVLGDFSMYQDDAKDRELLEALHGRKILIMGNHDLHRTPEKWRKLGFAECSPWPIVYREFYLLSHEPMYINSNMPYANVYGHVHNNPSYRDASPQSVCVSVERIGYQPILFEDIKEKIIRTQE
ncbi:MAG: metallophosphoesterase [Lachnospiraceae bacterium]|nr:metallophosphoesterase [Lachnospiraceae bacterium]